MGFGRLLLMGDAKQAGSSAAASSLAPSSPAGLTGSRRMFLSVSAALGAVGLGLPGNAAAAPDARAPLAGAPAREPGARETAREARPATDAAVRPKPFKISLSQW